MKKNWIYFIGGVVVGIILTIVVFYFIGTYYTPESRTEQPEVQTENSNPKWFDSPGDEIKESSYQVMQVLEDHAALVQGKGDGHSIYTGAIYLIVNRTGKFYYDEEIIDVPSDKVVKQVGIYRYETRQGIEKTVPLIMIMDK